MVVDYCGVFRNLKKAFASYGGGSVDDNGKEIKPVEEEEQLFVRLNNAIEECDNFCKAISIELNEIVKANRVFKTWICLTSIPKHYLSPMNKKDSLLLTIIPLMLCMKPESRK